MPKNVWQMQSMLRKMRPAIMSRTGNVAASSSYHHCAVGENEDEGGMVSVLASTLTSLLSVIR